MREDETSGGGVSYSSSNIIYRHLLMTAAPPSQSLPGGDGGGIVVQKKIVSNGCMSHVVPLHSPADPHVSQLPRGIDRHKCWRQRANTKDRKDTMGSAYASNQIYAACSVGLAHLDSIKVYVIMSHEYFHRPWVSSFSFFPTRTLLRLHLTCICAQIPRT